MLKTTRLPDKPAPNRNDGSRSASSKNDNSRPASGKNNGDDKIDGYGGDGVEHAKKSGKLKGKNRLSPRNCLNPKAKNRKNCQKVGIDLILTLQRPDQAF